MPALKLFNLSPLEITLLHERGQLAISRQMTGKYSPSEGVVPPFGIVGERRGVSPKRGDHPVIELVALYPEQGRNGRWQWVRVVKLVEALHA